MTETARTPSLGARALQLYLDSNNLKPPEFARNTGLIERSVRHWLSGGTPKLIAAIEIEDITDGAVKARMWTRTG